MQSFDVKRPNRPTRDSAVEDQYEGAAAAAGYVAAHDGWGATARFFHSRLHAVLAAIAECPGGELIDVGCGPGMLVRRLLDARPGDFTITACDLSPAMVAAAVARAGDAEVHTMVARIEDLPVPDGGFDVVLAMGVLEYADAEQGLRELARIVRPNGLVLVTMLNPRSFYRLFEWSVWWPALRLLGRLEKLVGVPAAKRHGAPITGIRAYSRRTLCGKLSDLGLRPEEVRYFDLTPVPPPFDRVVRKFSRRWRAHPERTTTTRGPRRWMGTAYLVTARRTR